MTKEKLTALLTVIIPEGEDPRGYILKVLHPTVEYHFTMTDESQALIIEQQKRTIESLEAKVQQLLSRKYGMDDVEYIVRLHKDDSMRRNGRANGLSLRQCQHCHALVVEDLLLAHEERCYWTSPTTTELPT